MRIITPEKLDDILVKHLLWLDDQNDDGKRADLFQVNLSHADLTDVNLSGANLRGVNLSGAKLSDANLIGATLIDANLTNANLSGANLLDANLFSANLTDAKFGLNIIDAALIKFATFSQDALMWLILRKDWAKVKDTVTIVNN